MVAGQSQYDEEDNYNSDYPEVQSELLPGTQSEGIIAFPGLPEDVETMQIHLKGSSDNWELDIDPFVFNVDLE